MISIPKIIVLNAISEHSKQIESQTKKLRENLLRLFFEESVTEKWMIQYIVKMLDHSSELITCDHNRLKELKDEFDKVIKAEEVGKSKVFKDALLNRMRYTYLRSTFYPKYFSKIGIKSCVYCNAHLTITVEKQTDNELLAKYQVDHYWPKSTYPCFSTSLFNLYPACSSCNHIKNDDFVQFELYTDNTEYLPLEFNFELEDGCWIKYLEKFDRDEIKIRFLEPTLPAINPMGLKSIDEVFAITQIYQTQTEIVEELILKSQKYTEVYKQDLIKIYPELFTTSSLANRVLISNYSDIQDIHKRPMAKFTQDIARQLGLIT
ncbi:hypothetical protein D3C87_32400 [compost metagenome]